MDTSSVMFQEVMKYRGKGILITDEEVGHVLRLCLMKMEISGKSGDEYLQALFKDELRNHVVAKYVTAISIQKMDQKKLAI